MGSLPASPPRTTRTQRLIMHDKLLSIGDDYPVLLLAVTVAVDAMSHD